MARVTFYLDKPKERESMIFASYYFNRKRLRYYTREKILTKDWSKGRARRIPKYSTLNNLLDKIETIIKSTHLNLKLRSITPTLDSFKTEINNQLGISEDIKKEDFLPFIDEWIESRKNKVADSTIRDYKKTYNHLVRFSKTRKTTLTFESIDMIFYNKFLDYCYDDCGFAQNTAGNNIKMIKRFMSAAVEQDLIKESQNISRKFKKPSNDVDAIYLTLEDLEKIKSLKLRKWSHIDRVRDLFLIACYTGLRYSDFSKLKSDNFTYIEQKQERILTIAIRNQKTQEKTIIPVVGQTLKELIEKYEEKGKFKVPVDAKNQSLNRTFKRICQKAGIIDSVEVTKSKSGRPKKYSFKKYELVTAHTARRTFATNLFKMGIPNLAIMKMTGHKSEKIFLNYIRVSKEENAFLVAQFFKSSKD